MREVAALAGVSAKTVSRVMNNDRYVSDDVRTRVEKAIEELQYVPNALARTFRSGRDTAIGMAVPEISDPFFARMTESVIRVAREHQAAVLVTSLGNHPDGERPAVEALLARQVAGLIATPVAGDQSYLQAWQPRTALVFVDRVPTGIKADNVVEDDRGGAHAATTHLIEHGHRRIALIGDTPAVSTTARRVEGYEAALTEGGIDVDPSIMSLGVGVTIEAETALHQLLAAPEPPTAIFSSNARCSLAILPLLQAARRTDIAFISFGDFPLADILTPAISVVDQDPAAMGETAANLLFERMDNPSRRVRRQIVLPTSLVGRASCCAVTPSPPPPAARTRRPPRSAGSARSTPTPTAATAKH